MKCPTRMQHDVCHDCHGFSAAMQACEEGIPLASDLGASVNDAAKPCIHHELIIPRCLSECRSIHALAVQLNRKLCCSHCFVELIVAECLRPNLQTCIRNELIIPECLSKFSSIHALAVRRIGARHPHLQCCHKGLLPVSRFCPKRCLSPCGGI